jgi:hypothetical protein
MWLDPDSSYSGFSANVFRGSSRVRKASLPFAVIIVNVVFVTYR